VVAVMMVVIVIAHGKQDRRNNPALSRRIARIPRHMFAQGFVG
jgi:hypothetical protein